MRLAIAVMAVSALAATGCGKEERAATPPATATRTPTATATRAPEAAPARARSVRECAKLWNADALSPENYQVTANDFVADEAPVRVHVAYQRGHCFVVWPIGNRRIAYSSARDGRRPFTNPARRRLRAGERVPYNARADREGRLELDS